VAEGSAGYRHAGCWAANSTNRARKTGGTGGTRTTQGNAFRSSDVSATTDAFMGAPQGSASLLMWPITTPTRHEVRADDRIAVRSLQAARAHQDRMSLCEKSTVVMWRSSTCTHGYTGLATLRSPVNLGP